MMNPSASAMISMAAVPRARFWKPTAVTIKYGAMVR